MSLEPEIKKSVCYFCHNNCGVLVEVKDGRVIGVKRDPDFLNSFCEKPTMAVDFHYHPDRLNYPLKRKGTRGEGKWKRITWEQALDEIAEKLRETKEKFGPESLCTLTGDAHTDRWANMRFLNLFGSPNFITPASIDLFNALTAHYATYGSPSLENNIPGVTKCIVVWGGNDAVSHPVSWRSIVEAKKAGAKLITIDPRYTETAKGSDLWLQIRPGTDCALALAWLNVIISDELYDKEFVEKYTVGFDKIKVLVKDFTPGKVSEITWIPAEKIEESARMYASHKPAHIRTFCTGPDHIGRNAVQSSRARCILRAITGNLDVQGGEMLAPAGRGESKVRVELEIELNEKLPVEQRAKQLGADRFKVQSWPGYELFRKYTEGHPYAYLSPARFMATANWPTVVRAILTEKPYPVKSVIAQATNPLLWISNSKLVYQGLKALDLFVVMDVFMTPTAMLADYVLPATDWLERPVFQGIGFLNISHGGVRSVNPEAERRDDYQLWHGLGVRLGQDNYWWDTLEEAYGYRVEPAGFKSYQEFVEKQRIITDIQEYKKYERYPFATPSGKVELYSSIFKQLGYDPLPSYEEPPESPVSTPELAIEYPLILITGCKIKPYYHSEFRQIQSARKKHPDPLVQLHPDTAKEFDIADGDWVTIETPIGSVRQRALIDTGIDPRVISAEHAWWFPEDPAPEPSLYGVWKSNINALLDDHPDKCDSTCGSWPYKAFLCKIYKHSSPNK